MAKKIKYLEDQWQRERAEKTSALAADRINKLIDEKLDIFSGLLETEMKAMNEKITSLADILCDLRGLNEDFLGNFRQEFEDLLECEDFSRVLG